MARHKSEVENTEVPSVVEGASAPEEAAASNVEYREVLLLLDYVPAEPQSDEDAALREHGINTKVKAGTVIKLPRDEARRAIKLEIAEVSADLI